jgi:hypothetical protein
MLMSNVLEAGFWGFIGGTALIPEGLSTLPG